MICTAGLMPSAAQAAPIPAPAATPIDQAACIMGISVRPAARSTAAPVHVEQHVKGADAGADDHETRRRAAEQNER